MDSPREASLQDADLSSAMEPGTSFLVPGWYDESLRDSGPFGRVAVDPIISRCVRQDLCVKARARVREGSPITLKGSINGVG